MIEVAELCEMALSRLPRGEPASDAAALMQLLTPRTIKNWMTHHGYKMADFTWQASSAAADAARPGAPMPQRLPRPPLLLPLQHTAWHTATPQRECRVRWESVASMAERRVDLLSGDACRGVSCKMASQHGPHSACDRGRAQGGGRAGARARPISEGEPS